MIITLSVYIILSAYITQLVEDCPLLKKFYTIMKGIILESLKNRYNVKILKIISVANNIIYKFTNRT